VKAYNQNPEARTGGGDEERKGVLRKAVGEGGLSKRLHEVLYFSDSNHGTERHMGAEGS
jgi:hypothetical protein